MSSDEKMIEAIKKILSSGNTAEIKKRKNDVIILEVEKKIIYERLNGAGNFAIYARFPAFSVS